MSTIDFDSRNGLNMLQTTLSRPTFLSTCTNKSKGRGSLLQISGDENVA